jgi:hypothetical protein
VEIIITIIIITIIITTIRGNEFIFIKKKKKFISNQKEKSI